MSKLDGAVPLGDFLFQLVENKKVAEEDKQSLDRTHKSDSDANGNQASDDTPQNG